MRPLDMRARFERSGKSLARGDKGRTHRPDRLVFRWGAGGRRRGAWRSVRGRRCIGNGGRSPLLGRGRSRLGRDPRHLLRALFGDDNVALLFGGGFIVDALQRIGPCLAGSLARTGWIELLTVAERIRGRRVRLTVDRYRLIDVFAGIAIGEEGGLRRRTERLAGPFVVGEAGGHGGERDRKISAVAGADADGAEGTGLRTEIGTGRHRIVVVAEQIVEKIAGTSHGVGILRPAVALGQREQDRAPLIFAVGAKAAAQPLEAGRDLLQIGPHLLELVVDRTALRRLAREQREKSRAIAAHSPGLERDPIDVAALLGGGFLVATDLLVPGRVPGAAAAVEGGQLRFQPRTHRIDRRALRGRRSRAHLRPGVNAKHEDAEQRSAGQDRGEASNQRFRHIRPLERFSRRLPKAERRSQRGIPYPLLGAASRRFRGAGMAGRPRNLAAADRQRWQVMATYSLQRAWLQLSAALGTEPVISSGSTRR